MPKMIQIRNVPDELHRELEERAARTDMTLSDYLQRLLERAVRRVTPEEIGRHLEEREPVDPAETSAEAVRSERESR